MVQRNTLILLSIFLVIFLKNSLADNQTYPILRQVTAVIRHGARSPTNPYPNYEHQAFWKQGYGQLTTVGMQQMYKLGKVIRGRYDGLISDAYNRYEISVQSTDIDRALQSAEAMLAGLYPPAGRQVWNQQISWQPIAVHTVPVEMDVLLDLQTDRTESCPRYTQLKDETFNSQWYRDKNASFEEEYEYIQYHAGFTDDMNTSHAWDTWDALAVDTLHNLTIPVWATDDMMDVIVKEIIPFDYELKYNTPEKVLIKGGPLMEEVFGNIEAMVAGILDKRQKMFFYFGHDDNLVNQLLAYGVYDWTEIPFSAALFVETLQTSPHQFGIRLSLRNNSDNAQITTLSIPGCGEICPLVKVQKQVADFRLTPEAWRKACTKQNSLQSTDIIVMVCVGVGAMVFITVLIWVAVRKKPTYLPMATQDQNEDKSYGSTT